MLFSADRRHYRWNICSSRQSTVQELNELNIIFEFAPLQDARLLPEGEFLTTESAVSVTVAKHMQVIGEEYFRPAIDV